MRVEGCEPRRRSLHRASPCTDTASSTHRQPPGQPDRSTQRTVFSEHVPDSVQQPPLTSVHDSRRTRPCRRLWQQPTHQQRHRTVRLHHPMTRVAQRQTVRRRVRLHTPRTTRPSRPTMVMIRHPAVAAQFAPPERPEIHDGAHLRRETRAAHFDLDSVDADRRYSTRPCDETADTLGIVTVTRASWAMPSVARARSMNSCNSVSVNSTSCRCTVTSGSVTMTLPHRSGCPRCRSAPGPTHQPGPLQPGHLRPAVPSRIP